MKVYNSPIDAPEYDWSDSNFDWNAVDNKYFDDMKAKLIELGYTGKNTGETVYFPQGDGNATYMIAEHGRTFALIHCEVSDGYSIPEPQLRGYTKAEILQLVQRQKSVVSIFSK